MLRELPEVDILVNNLGIFGARTALEISDDEWRRYFEINVLAAVRLTRDLPARACRARLGPDPVHRQRLRHRHPRPR